MNVLRKLAAAVRRVDEYARRVESRRAGRALERAVAAACDDVPVMPPAVRRAFVAALDGGSLVNVRAFESVLREHADIYDEFPTLARAWLPDARSRLDSMAAAADLLHARADALTVARRRVESGWRR